MDITAEFKRNTLQNGVEIYFSGDPGVQIKSKLITNRWRYNGKRQCWYIYYTENNLKFATEIIDLVNPKRERTNNIKRDFSYKYYSPMVHSTKESDPSMAPIERPLGRYMAISPTDVRYKKKRSFFS